MTKAQAQVEEKQAQAMAITMANTTAKEELTLERESLVETMMEVESTTKV